MLASEQACELRLKALGRWSHELIAGANLQPSMGPVLLLGQDCGWSDPDHAIYSRLSMVVTQNREMTCVRWFDPTELPFQDSSFDRIILFHMLTDGEESELKEACRVLSQSGRFIIIGLNRLGWTFRTQKSQASTEHQLPGIKLLKLRANLARLGMRSEYFAGTGIFGKDLPTSGLLSGRLLVEGSRKLLAPVSDLVIMSGTSVDRSMVTPLRFRRTDRKVQSAAIHG